jgi:hypothetical protein
VKKVPRDVKEE